jgi:L-ascorbate metabolism protein UlaG (beta-lactamase superfamily)
MKLQLIRNATMRLTYSNVVLLTDPLLSEKGAMPSYVGMAPNPVKDLPFDLDTVLSGIQAVLVSHLHSDHFDPIAKTVLPRDLPLLCQPPDKTSLEELGFTNVHPVGGAYEFEGITFSRTQGRHGTGRWAEDLGPVSGFVLTAPGEPAVYWAGDTVACDAMEEVIKQVRPDIIIVHSSGAKLPGSDIIVMDHFQTVDLCRRVPNARVVAVHMEALDHATVTRDLLRKHARASGISPKQLVIPEDGQVLEF